MKICGACVRELSDDSYSVEQRERRQSIRRCEECVATGNQLVLMKKGRTRPEEDDCPICQLPLPLDVNQSMFKACCMKEVCNGCVLATRKRGMRDCPFCRASTPDEEQALVMIRKRVAVGDPVAIWNLGTKYESGEYGLEKDVVRAVEQYERAAELGVKDAHYNLGVLYAYGTDVEKDMYKAFRHYEAAAMCGHVNARHNLGCIEGKAGNYDLALQHMMIAAKLGDVDSLNIVKSAFMSGDATRADYAVALRGHQNAKEEMSSSDRDEAKAFEMILRGKIEKANQQRRAQLLSGESISSTRALWRDKRRLTAGVPGSRVQGRIKPTADVLTRAAPPSRPRSLRRDLARNSRTERGRPKSQGRSPRIPQEAKAAELPNPLTPKSAPAQRKSGDDGRSPRAFRRLRGPGRHHAARVVGDKGSSSVMLRPRAAAWTRRRASQVRARTRRSRLALLPRDDRLRGQVGPRPRHHRRRPRVAKMWLKCFAVWMVPVLIDSGPVPRSQEKVAAEVLLARLDVASLCVWLADAGLEKTLMSPAGTFKIAGGGERATNGAT
ncbi:hypothetical protein THAOC_28973 [Thalassiosira oceanica]|uniref:RING-type domain-containing protein n=1 Tax=Thalassiosira oceanica TaxID=159749 RepID=K0RDM5_THAOC|nr:hypothetical protein THAOC_28973 [Thalassiosira oceanica]|eukprot:EJK51823.1 hypothetical protein THAOC_28973 [Thalassiosira oceanica]